MGGWGSGRTSGAACTDKCRSIDIRRWQRENPGVIGVKQLGFRYCIRKNGGGWQDTNQLIDLTTTPCTYGGERYWFLCPAQGCGRRVAILYSNNSIFACRHCYQLVYRCQRETTANRAARRVNKIRRRLGWQEGILNRSGTIRPKGMHRRTFERLQDEHYHHLDHALALMAAMFNIKLDG